MNRREFIAGAGLFVAASAVKTTAFDKPLGTGFTGSKPDVLVILVDELNPRFLGYVGDPNVQTPNIDRLAHEGMIFKIATLPVQPVCRHGPV